MTVPFSTNGVNLINEDDAWRMVLCHTEHLTNKFRTISEVFLDQFGANYSQEGGRCLVCNGFGEERLSSAGNAIKDHTFWRFNAHFFVEFGMCERKLNRFLKEL